MFGIAFILGYIGGVSVAAGTIELLTRLDAWVNAGGELTRAERRALDGAFKGFMS